MDVTAPPANSEEPRTLLGAFALCALAWVLPSEPPRLTLYFIVTLAYNAPLTSGLLRLYRLTAGAAGLCMLAVPAVAVSAGFPN